LLRDEYVYVLAGPQCAFALHEKEGTAAIEEVQRPTINQQGKTLLSFYSSCLNKISPAAREHQYNQDQTKCSYGTLKSVLVFRTPFNYEQLTISLPESLNSWLNSILQSYIGCLPGYGYDYDALEFPMPCRLCAAGEYSNPRSYLCLPCPAGTYSDVDGSTQCTACPANTATAVEGSKECSPCGHPAYSPLLCDAPSPVPSFDPTSNPSLDAPIWRETPCMIQGYGLEHNSATSAQDCLPCRVGTANDNNMQGRFCHQCPVGTYAPVEGSVTCTTCPTDSISVPQPGGTYCQPCGHTPYSIYECEAPTSPPTTEPSMVPFFEMGCSTPGYGLQMNANNVKECLPCPIGYANNNNYQGRYCRPCFNNSIAPQTGTVICTQCPADSISVPAYAGTYCTPITPTQTPSNAPVPAPTRTEFPTPLPTAEPLCVTPGYGLQPDSNNSLTCLPCPPGWYNNDYAGGPYCKPCTASIAPLAGSTGCTMCPSGTFAAPPLYGTFCAHWPWTTEPTDRPTTYPSRLRPTYSPITKAPTKTPSKSPTSKPSKAPVPAPTFKPSNPKPTRKPSRARPTYRPTRRFLLPNEAVDSVYYK
jgi:Tyrosine-protein kinase ephrin type A/B receptor-like